MHFTEATAPLFIDIDGGDGFSVVFVISTTNSGAQFARNSSIKPPPGRATGPAPANLRKRHRDERESETPSPAAPSLNNAMPLTPMPRDGSTRPAPQRVQPQWAVHRMDAATHARIMSKSPRTPVQRVWPPADSRGASPAPPSSMGPPPLPATFPRGDIDTSMSGNGTELGPTQLPSQGQMHEPLFLPSSQGLHPQMSQLQLQAAADLMGMTDEDLDALVADDDDFGLEADGSFAVLSSQKLSERPLAYTHPRPSNLFQSTVARRDSEVDELVDDEMLTPTQSQGRDDSIKVSA
jgi:hypothetical protein